MKLSNKTYDILKWILMTCVPAFILLITTLGTIYHFEEIANYIDLTISAVAVFLRTILGVSNKNYKEN